MRIVKKSFRYRPGAIPSFANAESLVLIAGAIKPIKKNKNRNRREKVRIEVRPVYVGDRPMTEAIRNAVADKIKSSMDKAG